MNKFKPTSAKIIEEYVNLIDKQGKDEIQKLHDFTKKTVPQEKSKLVWII